MDAEADDMLDEASTRIAAILMLTLKANGVGLKSGVERAVALEALLKSLAIVGGSVAAVENADDAAAKELVQGLRHELTLTLTGFIERVRPAARPERVAFERN